MERGLLLDIIVRQSSTVFKLFARKDETLLVRGDAFFVLNLGLHVIDGVRGLNFKSDRLTSKAAREKHTLALTSLA